MTPGPTTSTALIDFVHDRRAVVGGVLLALALGCVVVAGYCGYHGLKDALHKPADPTTDIADPKAGVVELEDPVPYRVGLAAALVAALGTGAVGAFFLARVPDADPDRRRRTDRILLLVVGYVFGLGNRITGLFLFIYWFPKLGDWVKGEAGSHKTGWWPVAALLQYLLGAGVTFLATLPARAEERNHVWIRRAVYAVNFALSAVLLVIGLTLANAVVAKKLPDKLDTTATGFYTLTDQTREYVAGLKRPMVAYVLTGNLAGEGMRIQEDVLRLLNSCRQVNPARFEVEVLTAESSSAKLQELQQDYKAADLQRLGVLLTFKNEPGKVDDRFEQIPIQRMVSQSRSGKINFIGEPQLVAGMMALTEERTTVYFTRGAGEMTVERPGEAAVAGITRPAFRLQDTLSATQCEARPLVIDPFADDPKVPHDAGMVVVLDPITALPPSTVAAIQKYMTTPRTGGKKGKLLVFSAAHNAPAGNVVSITGLEPLLTNFGIDLGNQAIYSQPVSARMTPDQVIIGADEAIVRQRNPIALAGAAGINARITRPVSPAGGGREPNGSAQPLLYVVPQGATWVEKGLIDPPKKAWDDLLAADQRRDKVYKTDRQVSFQERPVAAFATDAEGKPITAVFGFADGLADDANDGGRTATVFRAAVGWLRERPTAPDITPKEYAEYLPRKVNNGNVLLTVPVGGTLLAIVLLGLGVWAVRRK